MTSSRTSFFEPTKLMQPTLKDARQISGRRIIGIMMLYWVATEFIVPQ
jgi:hypothetical protein